jgi:lipoprotein signal peptidase
MRHYRSKIAIILMSLVIIVDQISKWYVLHVMNAEAGQPIPVISNFNVTLVHNRGVTFGLLNNLNHEWVTDGLIAVAVLVVLVLGRWMWRTSSTLVCVALGAIMGGAVGNIMDRVRYGAVVDFLDVYYKNYHWPSFNVADSMIVCGVGLLLIDSMVRAK